ncbi:hypothetical protein N752_23240 [Desulforamulus aquiferis]|nr:hypothetical protein N752_23240 [Desulforamulus aquiferis]
MLPLLLVAREKDLTKAIIPLDNVNEGGLVRDITVFGSDSLGELARALNGEESLTPYTGDVLWTSGFDRLDDLDFKDVRGQLGPKRALEIAAAGGHNVLMLGSPGCGKTMLARRLPSILPDLTFDEAIEVTKIYSLAGQLTPQSPLINKRPFRFPHHTSSLPALWEVGAFQSPVR